MESAFSNESSRLLLENGKEFVSDSKYTLKNKRSYDCNFLSMSEQEREKLKNDALRIFHEAKTMKRLEELTGRLLRYKYLWLTILDWCELLNTKEEILTAKIYAFAVYTKNLNTTDDNQTALDVSVQLRLNEENKVLAINGTLAVDVLEVL